MARGSFICFRHSTEYTQQCNMVLSKRYQPSRMVAIYFHSVLRWVSQLRRPFSALQNNSFDSLRLFFDRTLLVFSCERLLAVAKPFEFRNRMTIRKAFFIEAVLFLLSFISTIQHVIMWRALNEFQNGSLTSNSHNLLPAWLLRWEVIQEIAEV
jgi:hypothetical protein